MGFTIKRVLRRVLRRGSEKGGFQKVPRMSFFYPSGRQLQFFRCSSPFKRQKHPFFKTYLGSCDPVAPSLRGGTEKGGLYMGKKWGRFVIFPVLCLLGYGDTSLES